MLSNQAFAQTCSRVDGDCQPLKDTLKALAAKGHAAQGTGQIAAVGNILAGHESQLGKGGH